MRSTSCTVPTRSSHRSSRPANHQTHPATRLTPRPLPGLVSSNTSAGTHDCDEGRRADRTLAPRSTGAGRRPARPRKGGPVRALPDPGAADRRSRPRRPLHLSVLRRRLRPARLRQGRRGDADRRRPREPGLTRPAVPEGCRLPKLRPEPVTRIQGQVPVPVRQRLGRPFARRRHGDDRRPHRPHARGALAGDERKGRPRQPHAGDRQPRRRDAGQRGELPDQEADDGPRDRPGREPGAHMTQLHGPRSGDLVRPRRSDDLPAGPPALGLHPDHGLEHGGEPPRRVPVGDGGERARREGDPRRPALHANERDDVEVGRHPRRLDEYVKTYTNAPVIVDEKYEDTEDLDGFFSGWDPDEGEYDITTWAYKGTTPQTAPGKKSSHTRGEQSGHGGHGGGLSHGEPPEEDETLRHPRCIFQILKRHYARYTPEFVAEACGCSAEDFVEVAEAMCANSGRERTGVIVYAVGWTQHTVGVQIIRAAAIIQLLLGNVGRPGGGVMALRGHASIQGSTDI